jgi:hypothetical protein
MALNVINLTTARAARRAVQVEFFPVGPDEASVVFTTPNGVTAIEVSSYEAAALRQQLARSTDPQTTLTDWVQRTADL